MASKFFTWSKGERRGVNGTPGVGGLTPVSVDAPDGTVLRGTPAKGNISRINTSKTGRKPKPLTLLGLDSFPTIQYDAANSITDFQSIMDETAPSPSSLSSTPHLSLHPALRNSRSRSHTAPPTPIGEIPFIAELPGSLLQENEGYPATHQMSGDILLLGSEKMPPTFSNGLSLNSSNTSPQLSGSVANHKRSASENSAILTHNTQQKRDSSLPPIQRIISGDRNRPFSFISHETSDSKSQQISEQISSRYNGVSSQSSLHTVDDSMRQGNPQALGEVPCLDHLSNFTALISDRDRTITFLTAQLEGLQKSHNAYAADLSQAHDKELGALKLYAKCLEEQQNLSTQEHFESGDKENLRFETGIHHSPRSIVSVEGHTATSMSGFRSAFEEQQRASKEIASEMEVLRRKLSTAQKRDVEADVIRQEHSFLHEAVEAKQQHIDLLMRRLAQTQMAEKAANSTADAFEARLEIANAQKNDVLEENHELRQAALNLHNRERAMKQEIDDIYQRWSSSEVDMRNRLQAAEERADRLEETVQASQEKKDTESGISKLKEHIKHLELEEGERNHYVGRLEQELGQCRFKIDNFHIPQSLQSIAAGPSSRRDSTNRENDPYLATCWSKITELTRTVEERDASIESLQFERDNVTSLLQAEIRVRARTAPEQAQIANLALDARTKVDQALEEIQTKAHDGLTAPGTKWEVNSNPAERIEQLEREINYYIKDIILYKLDVKGYKKDIKRANAKIQRLQSSSVKSSPNPDSAYDSYRASSNALVYTPSQTYMHSGWPEPSTADAGLGILASDVITQNPARQNSLPPSAPPRNNSSSNASVALPSVPDDISKRPSSSSSSVSPILRASVAANKRLPPAPLTPPMSHSPTPASPNGDPQTSPLSTAPSDKSLQARSSTDIRPGAAASATLADPDLLGCQALEIQRPDLSLSESVAEALSGSSQMKSLLSSSPDTSTSHATAPVLVDDRRSLKEASSRRTESESIVVPLTIESPERSGENEAKDGEVIDSGIEFRG